MADDAQAPEHQRRRFTGFLVVMTAVGVIGAVWGFASGSTRVAGFGCLAAVAFPLALIMTLQAWRAEK